MGIEKIKQELRTLILSHLRLGNVAPDQFDDQRPLFDGNKEMDSIDVLLLVLEIEKKFKIRLVVDQFDPGIWQNLNTLAAAIEKRIAESC